MPGSGGPRERPLVGLRPWQSHPHDTPVTALPSHPRWFCHVDDDNYVNVRALLRLLGSYPHTQDVYLGKPSLDRPIQATERVSENKVVSVPPPRRQPAPTRGEEAGVAPRPGTGGLGVSPRPPRPRLPTASCPLLVCHRRGWLLHQPRAGPEDEPLGQVSALGHR